MPDEPLLRVEEVSKHFKVRGRTLHAVERVSFELDAGQTLGLVGESGSGKSTLGRVALRLLEADAGRVVFQGRDIAKLSSKELRQERRHMQIIFQDPLASLNSRMTVGAAIEDAMIIQGVGTRAERRKHVDELLERVGLPLSAGNAFPFELSGGQQQRVGIARALAVKPKLVVCDEPISALDVSIQVQIIDLLKDLQKEMNLAYIFISHNLGVVQYLSDRVMVLYLGEVVEQGTAQDLFADPQHPYTRVLIDSILKIPESSAERRPMTGLPGEMPSPFSPPVGCPFHPRCALAQDRCSAEKPQMRAVADGHLAACHFAG
ncbi:MAG: ABC transporter ATP-binding protein [Firmicutes bacterium]|nr:ABC transporter ATP-binding protein [Bacillota bacterium]